MLKLTAIVSLMLIATCSHAEPRRQKKEATPSQDFDSGSTLWAASLSCDSCGSECASACGTRHFRSCCFNYLRKKRGPEGIKVWTPSSHDLKEREDKIPIFIVRNPSEPWFNSLSSNDYKPYPFEDTVDNQLQIIYDA